MSAVDTAVREADLARAAHYSNQAAKARSQARDLTSMADELVTEAFARKDSDPLRHAGLRMAAALRDGANGYTDSAETFEVWAADLLAHANGLVAS